MGQWTLSLLLPFAVVKKNGVKKLNVIFNANNVGSDSMLVKFLCCLLCRYGETHRTVPCPKGEILVTQGNRHFFPAPLTHHTLPNFLLSLMMMIVEFPYATASAGGADSSVTSD